ncbi:MAG: hypothetical protein IIX09_07570 [Clostridia bacterium]|nr:hypothetical protein [Clostridia bacterium]
MKNSFEWKKDINNKVVEKRERIAKRNAQMRTISGMSLALLVCLGCSVAVVRFSKINQPPVDTINNGIMTIPNFTDYTFPSETVQNTTDGKGVMTITVPPETEPPQTDDSGVMTIPSFPHTYPGGTGKSPGVVENSTDLPYYTGIPSDNTEDYLYEKTEEIGNPSYTGQEPDWYPPDWQPPSTSPDIEVITTTVEPPSGAFRYAKHIVNQIFPSPLYYPTAVEQKLTFAEALSYFGLDDFNVAPALRTSVEYHISFADEYTFLVDESVTNERIILRDAVIVNYVSENTEEYFELSIGLVCLPYDWGFTTSEDGFFNYRNVEVLCGYIGANGISAELIVADFEYNGIKYRFCGHNVTEKEYLSCLYTVIDCLFRK